MKKRKLLTSVLCVLTCLFMLLGLSACGGHKHEFSSSYQSDAVNHWYACSCGEKKDIAEHTFTEGVCVCGKTLDECFDDLVDSVPELKSGEGINLSFSVDKYLMKGTSFYLPDISGKYTHMSANVEASGNIEAFISLDDDGEPSIYAHAEAVSEKKVNDKTYETSSVTVNYVVKGNAVYGEEIDKTTYPHLPEALQKLLNDEEVDYYYQDLTEELPDGSDYTMFGQLLQNPELTAKIEEFMGETLLPTLDDLFGEYANVIAEKFKSAVFTAFKTTIKDGGYQFEYDFTHLKKINEKLAEPTSELYDEIFGEGSFKQLEADVLDLLDLTMNDVLMKIFTEEFTLDDLEKEINEIIALAYKGEEQIPTLEDFIQADFLEMLRSEEFKNTTVGELLADGFETTVEDLKSEIPLAFDKIGETSVYSLLFVQGEESDEIVAEIVEKVNEFIDAIDSIMDAKIIVNEDGVCTSIVIDFDLDYQTLKKIAGVFNPDEAFDLGVSDLEFEGSGEITFGNFANASETDYDKVMENAKNAA